MSRPPFQVGLNIDTSEELSPGLWRVAGDVVDNTALGYTAVDAGIGNYIYCETEYGDIDLYRITVINSKVGARLDCQVIYFEPGAPALGYPSTGLAALCAYPDQPPTQDTISPFLSNGIRNLNSKLLTNTYLDIVADTATGDTSVYTLTKTPTGIGQIAVFLNGVLQPTASYSIVGTTLTFPANVPAGWRVAALYPVHPYE